MVTVPIKHGPNSVEVAETSLKKKRKWATVGGCFDRLPCEILHNIALMLPFTSIKQLRRSSKFWHNLLTDPKFVNLHLTCSLQKPPGYLFTATYNRCRQRKLGCYFVEQSGGHLNTSKIFEYSKHCTSIGLWCQSSGGLICVYSSQSNSFRVFNPDIGEEVQVSDVPKIKNWFTLQYWFFGYSPSSKEYKILEIGKLNDGPETGVLRSTMGAITTIGSNIWRDIQNVPSDMYIFSIAECQGNLFWRHNSNVVSFDLVSEKFHEIPSPPSDLTDFLNRSNLMGDDLISMSNTVGYVQYNRLWVLEDKIKGIWIKRYDFSSALPVLKQMHQFTGVSENGGLFGHVQHSINVFSHDMGCTGLRVMEIELDKRRGGAAPSWVSYIAPHVRSLVSPVRIMENGRKTNRKRKWVLDRLKLGDDASEDDLFDSIYQLLNASDE